LLYFDLVEEGGGEGREGKEKEYFGDFSADSTNWRTAAYLLKPGYEPRVWKIS
jgi:hypothetical protein